MSAYEESKEALLNSSVLVFYDPQKPVLVKAEASPYGIGAVLCHLIDGQERPIMFISRTLTDAERNYAQIHREALALIYAVKKFHKYLYGKKFVLITDHKPLEAILGSKAKIPIVAASRLQRWSIILSAYDYTLVFKKSSDLAPADAMSRFPLAHENIQDEIFNISEFCEPLTSYDIQECTKKRSSPSQSTRVN